MEKKICKDFQTEEGGALILCAKLCVPGDHPEIFCPFTDYIAKTTNANIGAAIQ